jgi:hypothetical protein
MQRSSQLCIPMYLDCVDSVRHCLTLTCRDSTRDLPRSIGEFGSYCPLIVPPRGLSFVLRGKHWEASWETLPYIDEGFLSSSPLLVNYLRC